jgi:hypothetical protein
MYSTYGTYIQKAENACCIQKRLINKTFSTLLMSYSIIEQKRIFFFKEENGYQMSILSSHGLVVERGFQTFSPVRSGPFGILHEADRESRVSKHSHLSDQGLSAFFMKPTEKTGFPNIITCSIRAFQHSS